MEIKRQLATIKVVSAVEPIEGADKICMVRFNESHWVCVMQKEEAFLGSKVVYFEVDSVLPLDDDRYSFLQDKRRIKTIKLRGQISQGLSMPLSKFPELENAEEFQDVTDILGVTKYEIPETFLPADAKGAFPGFLSKTDEPRLQNFRESEIQKVFSSRLVATIKVDGSSGTFYYNEGTFGLCSRNLELKNEEKSTYGKLARKYNIEERLSSYGKNLSIQGETVGPGIQNNRLKLTTTELQVFSITDIDTGIRYDQKNLELCLADLNVFCPEAPPLVSVEVAGTFEPNFFKSFDDLQNYVESYVSPKGLSIEGMVFRNADGNSNDVSFKVLNRNYLLKHDS